jgi:rubrerythrin
MKARLARFEREARAAWRDPSRRAATLESFAKTELDGAADLRRAARLTTDRSLRTKLERHADDEERHGRLFQDAAAEARALARRRDDDAPADPRPFEPFEYAADRGAHGFLPPEGVEERGDLAYVAALHVAETRAAEIFAVLRRAWAEDPAIVAVLDAALKDENVHVAYTKKYLDDAASEGKAREARSALRLARGARFGGALGRFSARTARRVGVVLLGAFYFVAAPLFALAAKLGREAPAHARRGTARDRLREPY